MHQPLLALAIAATLGALHAPALAMGEGDYQAEKERLEQSYNAERKRCRRLAGDAGGNCLDKVRQQESIALDKLKAAYQASSERGARGKASP